MMTFLCLHCGRPIRAEARAYAISAGAFHWECTEPAPALNIQAIKIGPDDKLVVLFEGAMSREGVAVLSERVRAALGVEPLILDRGLKLSVLRKEESEVQR